jgi:hypothetical protein
MGSIGKPLLAAFLVACCCFPAWAQNAEYKASPNTKTRTVVDLSSEELRRLYGPELGHVVFDDAQEELRTILSKVGNNVDAFFRNMPNTASKEQILSQRIKRNGELEASVRSTYNYLLLARPEGAGLRFEEDRTDSKGHPAEFKRLSEYLVTSGFASQCMFLHFSHQYGSRFRYLGKQPSEPRALVIAFSQKPEVGDFMTSIQGQEMARVLLQGLIWIDPLSYQIVRIRTDLLEPDVRNGVMRETTDVWLTEVHFEGIEQAFWLPREVEVTCDWFHNTFRNLHSYSDYKLFTVSSYDKIVKP